MSTSIGVCQGNDHADFVFGKRSDANGLSFRFANDLCSLESLAQQQLDFIQRLYLKQSRPGEFFQEIHLAGSLGDSLDGSGVDRPCAIKSKSPTSNSPIRDCQNLLRELLQAWINDNELDLKIAHHRELSIQNRKTFLQDHQLFPSSLALKEYDLTEPYTLWSMAYPGTPDSFNASGYKTFKTLDYRKIDNLKLPNFLEDYKQELVWKYNATKFIDYESENERHYLITLAEDSDTTRHELLGCQETIVKLQERKKVSSIAANDPVTETEMEMPIAVDIERYTANYANQPLRRQVSALPNLQIATSEFAIDMDMDRTAEIPADIANELTAEMDDELAAELTAEITAEIPPEWTEGLAEEELSAEVTGGVAADNPADESKAESKATNVPDQTLPEERQLEERQLEGIQLQEPAGLTTANPVPTELAIEEPAYIAPTIGPGKNTVEKKWQEPNARRAMVLDAGLFGLAVLAAISGAFYILMRLQ